LSSGQQCSYPVKQGAAKYGKLAYSSAFAYSVPVGSGTLEELGGDSTLALSDDAGESWKVRRDTRQAKLVRVNDQEGYLVSFWYPWPDVEVETWLVPPSVSAPAWHVRVHRIKTGRKLWSAEGGFAIYGQGKDGRALASVESITAASSFGTYAHAGEALTLSQAGVSAALELNGGQRSGQALRTDANTNLVVARAVLPTLRGIHEPASENIWLAAGFFAIPSVEGESGPPVTWEEEYAKKPIIPEYIPVVIGK
jgi:hypothetical protein